MKNPSLGRFVPVNAMAASRAAHGKKAARKKA